jgi:hypothetical protein
MQGHVIADGASDCLVSCLVETDLLVSKIFLADRPPTPGNLPGPETQMLIYIDRNSKCFFKMLATGTD